MLLQLVEVAPANWVRLTGEQIIDDRAVVLYGVQIYATADDVITFYDGQNTNAPAVFSVQVGANKSKNRRSLPLLGDRIKSRLSQAVNA
jgi:hypothetical protein